MLVKLTPGEDARNKEKKKQVDTDMRSHKQKNRFNKI